MQNLPNHIGFIMDGNGRWAMARGLPRSAGHLRGAQRAKEVVRAAFESGVEIITLFCFSSENWERPQTEINYLMDLFKTFLANDLAQLHKEGVQINIIGTKDNLPTNIAEQLSQAELLTKDNKNKRLVIALNYGSRDEIVRTAKSLATKVGNGELMAEEIDETLFAKNLDTANWHDPDLIIRTSGEQRLSNFLLWQSAYCEFLFINCHWPDFDSQEFFKALDSFAARQRRFGGVEMQEIEPQKKVAVN